MVAASFDDKILAECVGIKVFILPSTRPHIGTTDSCYVNQITRPPTHREITPVIIRSCSFCIVMF
jgi:hypothetical protein